MYEVDYNGFVCRFEYYGAGDCTKQFDRWLRGVEGLVVGKRLEGLSGVEGGSGGVWRCGSGVDETARLLAFGDTAGSEREGVVGSVAGVAVCDGGVRWSGAGHEGGALFPAAGGDGVELGGCAGTRISEGISSCGILGGLSVSGDDVIGDVPVVSGEKVVGSVEVAGSVVPGLSQSSGVSEKTLRNRRWRQERKERKQVRQSEGRDVRSRGVPRELSESWIARKNAENELAAEKARKDLEYQRSRDVQAEAKKSRVKLMETTERAKVAVEKAFSTLKSTGNVPGYCETVLTKEPSLTEGETISPDSSISQAEIRAMHKELLDCKAKIRDFELQKVYTGQAVTFPLNSEGTVAPSLRERLKEMDDDEAFIDERGDKFDGGIVRIARIRYEDYEREMQYDF